MTDAQTPTVFVALMLAPGQFGLFEEIEDEAAEVLDERPTSRAGRIADGDDLVLLDRDNLRLALAWSALPSGEALTLAIGAQPDRMLGRDEAREAATLLRDLVQRAEALFEVQQSLWQIALLPLTSETMDDHALRLSLLDPEGSYQTQLGAITIDPDQIHARPRVERKGTSAGDVLAEIRAAVGTDEAPSWAMQASALALSTAFAIVTPPVGIAMLTYAALRQGTDMNLLPGQLNVGQADPSLA